MYLLSNGYLYKAEYKRVKNMKRTIFQTLIAILVFTISVNVCIAQSGSNRPNNSISGFVFDSVSRIPVSEVYVELMNDTYSTLKRVKTDGTGRFSFHGLSSGTFVVKVTPYGTNYLEESQSATIINNNIGGSSSSDSIYLDIYLRLDKRKINNEFQPAGAVFIQEVPAAAKDFYKKAIIQLDKSKQTSLGLENLKKALEIFPDYYDALNRLGFEHVRQNQYYEALPFLVKAVQLNQRSFSSFYALGIAAYHLKQMKEAAEAFRLATVINSQSVYAQFQYGRALRLDGNYKEAKEALLKAKSLDKDLVVAEIYWQLGLLYEKIGRYNEAADELEIYIKIHPDINNLQQIKDLISKLRIKAKK
jgi:hypothetical protein